MKTNKRKWIITTRRGRTLAQFRSTLNVANGVFDMLFSGGDYRALVLHQDCVRRNGSTIACSAEITRGYTRGE